MVKLLISKGADVEAQDGKGNTCLLHAADRGHTEVVRALLAAGARVNHTDRTTRSTALLSAASQGHHRVVELLLEAGADPNIVDAWGGSPLLRAARDGQAGCVERLLK